jgi:hypothetical protein
MVEAEGVGIFTGIETTQLIEKSRPLKNRKTEKLIGMTTGFTEEPVRVIPFKSRRKNGGGGGSRTPVRKALRPEDYMLSSVQFVSPAALRMSKKRNKLVRWFSPELYGPKSSSQPAE